MGRPKAEKKSNGNVARRQAELKMMCGAVETQAPKPFDPGFLNRGTKTVSEVNPLDKMTREDLQEFIDNFELYSGQEFDDPGVKEKFFGKYSEDILGLIDGRKMIYLMCIDRVPGITIEEFLFGVINPTMKHQLPYSKAIDIISEWMICGILKNHRLSPDEKDSGYNDYSLHRNKKLELTDDGKQLIHRIEALILPLTRDMMIDAMTRRSMLIEKMRKEEKKEKKSKEKKKSFSKDTLDTVAKMKELLGHK